MESDPEISLSDRFSGCLLGGAVGDALGAPIEFDSRLAIESRWGPDGVRDYVPAYGGLGRITDDTQMTLFTAEALIRSEVRFAHRGISNWIGIAAKAYLRWLRTQGESCNAGELVNLDNPGWLYRLEALHARRSPGTTCLNALREMTKPGEMARNDSKGCGGVMRVAPVGLWFAGSAGTDQTCFQLGCDLAGLTHGHPTGQLTAGVFALLVSKLTQGETLNRAWIAARRLLCARSGHEETLHGVDLAFELAEHAKGQGPNRSLHASNIAQLGEGWIAEEALAVAVYCALVADSFEHGICLAINHDGDSDSTGSIAGNLMGCMAGLPAIPSRWLGPLELREEINRVALDLCHFGRSGWIDPSQPDAESDDTWNRYPGG